MKTIEVNVCPAYSVKIGGGLLTAAGAALHAAAPGAEKAAVVTDDNVELLWADRLEAVLRDAGFETARFVIPHGEAQKSPESYFALLTFLAEEGFSRTDAVLALGGGTVCDLAGFAAATYLRGVPLGMLPTTLLAMADAAVGGKTGIDLPAGKNLVGAFYQPAFVLCDTDTLNTLPQQQFSEGCAEILKCAVLGDRALFEQLCTVGRGFDREAVITACIGLKAACVAADEHDRGQRRLLNLGHTVGHAIEAKSNYTVSHGIAVAMGLAVIARAAAAHGICGADCAEAVTGALTALGLPAAPCFGLTELLPFLMQDKKRRGSEIDLIVPETVGRCRVETVPAAQLEAFLKAGF